jgi:hypothetical protein
MVNLCVVVSVQIDIDLPVIAVIGSQSAGKVLIIHSVLPRRLLMLSLVLVDRVYLGNYPPPG